MGHYQSNIWLIDENEFDQFTITGGKVIYIVDESSMTSLMHPAVTTAGTLLPPIESIQAELDGNMEEAVRIYEQYLNSSEPSMYISIIVAAAIKQIPIGIMFGKDELVMKFPTTLINYLFRVFGLVVGIPNKVPSYIVAEAMPYTLAMMYCMNFIDYPTYMEKHPPLPLHEMSISKLAIEVKPLVEDKTFNGYYEYFTNVLKCVQNHGGKFTIDPLEAI